MTRLTTALLLLIMLLALPTPAPAQGIEWQRLNEEVMSLHAQGQYDRAVVVAKKALALVEKTPGADPGAMARSLEELALLYETQGQYAEAELFFTRSLAVLEKAFGPDDLPSRSTPARRRSWRRPWARTRAPLPPA